MSEQVNRKMQSEKLISSFGNKWQLSHKKTLVHDSERQRHQSEKYSREDKMRVGQKALMCCKDEEKGVVV